MQKYILKMVHFHLRTIYLYTTEEEKKKCPPKVLISALRWLFSRGFSKMRCWLMFSAVNNSAASET